MRSEYFRRKYLQAKGFIFSYYWIIPLGTLSFITGLYVKELSELKQESIASLIGGTFALLFFIQKQKLDEANFFQNLFKDFNKRYDDLNNKLDGILQGNKLDTNQRHALVDYFNLCAEEYLLYKQGYIPLEVWESWVAGMLQYWEISEVRQLWEHELKTSSYYGFDPQKEFEIIEPATPEINVAA